MYTRWGNTCGWVEEFLAAGVFLKVGHGGNCPGESRRERIEAPCYGGENGRSMNSGFLLDLPIRRGSELRTIHPPRLTWPVTAAIDSMSVLPCLGVVKRFGIRCHH